MPERTVQRCMKWLIEKGFVQTYWAFPHNDKLRQRKVLHYRINLTGLEVAPQPDYSSCPQNIRRETIARFFCICQYCGLEGDDEKGPDGETWHIDRIIPGSKGGKYVAHNITLSCRTCNIGKGARLAPLKTVSLGAILDGEGCQNEQNKGATSGTLSVSRTVSEPSYESLPSEEAQNLSERDLNDLWKEMRKVFKRKTAKSLGTPRGRLGEQLRELAIKHGTDKVLAGFVAFVEHEQKENLRRLRIPGFIFLKDAESWIDDAQITEEPEREIAAGPRGVGSKYAHL